MIAPILFSLVAGCHGPEHSDNQITEPPEVTNSVAQQALGTGAISVYPFTPSAIKAPGIYKIVLVNGIETYSPVCPSTTTRLGP